MINRDIGFLIKLIHDQLGAKVNVFLKKSNLTMSQGQILGYLKNNQDKIITQKDLEIAFCVSHPAISRMLKELEKKGFVYTYFNPNKKTMKIVKLTEAEEEIFKLSEKKKKEFEERLLVGFTGEEKKQLTDFLVRVYNNLHDKE